MTREDKIKFYELINEYLEECKTEIRAKEKPLPDYNIRDFSVLVMLHNHVKVLKEIQEVLSFDF